MGDFKFTQLVPIRDIKTENINGNKIEFIKEDNYYYVRINNDNKNVLKYLSSKYNKNRIMKELKLKYK